MDSATNSDHSETAVLDLCGLIVLLAGGAGGDAEGVDAKVSRVFATLFVDLLVCGALACSNE